MQAAQHLLFEGVVSKFQFLAMPITPHFCGECYFVG